MTYKQNLAASMRRRTERANKADTFDLIAALRAIVRDYESMTDLQTASDVAHMMAKRAKAAIERNT